MTIKISQPKTKIQIEPHFKQHILYMYYMIMFFGSLFHKLFKIIIDYHLT